MSGNPFGRERLVRDLSSNLETVSNAAQQLAQKRAEKLAKQQHRQAAAQQQQLVVADAPLLCTAGCPEPPVRTASGTTSYATASSGSLAGCSEQGEAEQVQSIRADTQQAPLHTASRTSVDSGIDESSSSKAQAEAPKKLSRLRKAGEGRAIELPPPPCTTQAERASPTPAADDLAASLAGLNLKAAEPSANPAQRAPLLPTSSTALQSIATCTAASQTQYQLSAVVQRTPSAATAAHTLQQEGSTDSKTSKGDTTKDLVLGENQEFRLSGAVAGRLYAHQVSGVTWLYSLHRMRRGGILADDMGLGKTLQCAAFLAGMLQSKLIRRALVLAPKTLLAHWVKELSVCGLASCTHQFYGSSKAERDDALQRVHSRPGVLLTTYGMALHNAEALAERPHQLCYNRLGDRDAGDHDGPLWDFMLLDEGHKVKNPKMQLALKLRQVPAAVRLVISGTPVQNNLLEMHALFDFACPDLLGDARHFRQYYAKRITAGSDKNANHWEREVGAAKAAELRRTVAPYFMRREKSEVLLPGSSDTSGGEAALSEAGSAGSSGPPQPQAMGRKNDFIIWLRLAPLQRRIYEAFLHSEPVKAALNQTGSVLAAITVLKKVCDHPALLSENAAKLLASDDEDSSDDEVDLRTLQHSGGSEPTSGVEGLLAGIADRGVEASCKTAFLVALLAELIAGGHRTLVFSQSRVMLDIIAAAVSARGWAALRIDGSVTCIHERAARVKRFQEGSDIALFLLTSQVGGLGLTLTGADRVVICDPAWNPATDSQSVDRAYRIGQRRDVVVYRLVSCGTVEEKMYRKQVFKGGLSRAASQPGSAFRYFSHQELRDLFRLVPEELEASSTQAQLHALHAAQRVCSPALDAHLDFLTTLPAYAGISDHDLLYSREGEVAASTGQQPPAPRSQASPAAVRRRARTVAEWGGAGSLSSMFSRIVSLEDAPSHKTEGLAAAFFATSLTNQQQVCELQERLKKLKALLADLALVRKLSDGGAKIQRTISELTHRLHDVQGSNSSAPAVSAQAELVVDLT